MKISDRKSDPSESLLGNRLYEGASETDRWSNAAKIIHYEAPTRPLGRLLQRGSSLLPWFPWPWEDVQLIFQSDIVILMDGLNAATSLTSGLLKDYGEQDDCCSVLFD